MEKKVCPKCQREIDATMSFCGYCGEPQPNVSQRESRREAFPPEPTPQQWPRREATHTPQPDRRPDPPTKRHSSHVPIYHGETGGGMGWIVLMRVVLWIVFAAGIIASLAAAVPMMEYGIELEGLGIVLGGILGSFVVVGSGMVALNSASNTRKSANNTAKIISILQNQRK